MASVFSEFDSESWPYRYRVRLRAATLAGGVPSDPHVAAGFIKSKIKDSDDIIRELVASTMLERGVSAEEAVQAVDELRHLKGFKRSASGQLLMEGRQVKAAIKEAVSVAFASGKLLNAKGANSWGKTGKGIHSFVAEHVMVEDYYVYLYRIGDDGEPVAVTEPDTVMQRFVHTFRGTGIQYEEMVTDVILEFTLKCDWEFTRQQWGMIWTTGEMQGIGTSRSQGYGRYVVESWELVTGSPSAIEAAGQRAGAASAAVPPPRGSRMTAAAAAQAAAAVYLAEAGTGGADADGVVAGS